jgi:poly(A) polymerase Pap1
MSDIIARILANDFITNAVNIISDLNKKAYEENLIEFNDLFSKYNDGIDTSAMTKAFDELKRKYSS